MVESKHSQREKSQSLNKIKEKTMANGQDKIYAMVTETVVNAIENAIQNGTSLPWQKPWNNLCPQNLITKKPYRGINVWLLSFLPYASPYYMSAKQVKDKGGMIKKGEKGHLVVFWRWIKIKDKATQEEKQIPFLRYYKVWNLEQTEGIEAPKTTQIVFNPIEQAESIIKNMPHLPSMRDGLRACYTPSIDTVTMPPKTEFHSVEEYYSTLFHELAHATGHGSRLNRPEIVQLGGFGSHEYSKEELVAEMTATFLCATAGIKAPFDNSIAYLNGWLAKLKSDPKLIVQAGGQSQKACDYILNIQFNKTENAQHDKNVQNVQVTQKVQYEPKVMNTIKEASVTI